MNKNIVNIPGEERVNYLTETVLWTARKRMKWHLIWGTIIMIISRHLYQ